MSAAGAALQLDTHTSENQDSVSVLIMANSPSYGTPADTPDPSVEGSIFSSLHKEPAAAGSASLRDIMRIQEDTKATVYLSNLLGDLGFRKF